MNSILFVTVAALAIHEIWACKRVSTRIHNTGVEDLNVTIKGDKWDINVQSDFKDLGMQVSYYENRSWNSDKYEGRLCDEDENLEVFKKLLYTSLGLDSCNISKGDYQSKKENEFSDDVCSKISELTNGNDNVLYLTVVLDGIAMLVVRTDSA
ncbi:uncharacterized protein LOC107047844 [Diachasma alloeum]|uniref:uncharacterized protein LOC107047844 n=1 Tax=Diachasma alloeum TaxID=454923 RepID=UPI0007383C16|nr:uncharacterized protein LOC107047844 [Diachasma alloeum]